MAERVAGALVLLVLAGIAGIMVARQLDWMAQREARAAARVAQAPAPEAPPVRTDPPSKLSAWVPDWPTAGPVERYDADRLYEKVNGHAGLYLDAGFEGLEAQRFQDPADALRSLELRLYTMSDPMAAATVRAETARPGGEPAAPGVDGQCLEGACFLAHGRFYLEVLPSPPGPALGDASHRVALAFVADTPGRAHSHPESGSGIGPGSPGSP